MTEACEQFLPLLPAYHDGELDPATRAQVEEHLHTCPACAAELDRLRAISEPLRALRNVEPTPQHWSRFRDAIDDAADDGRLFRTASTLAVMAASVLIVALAWLNVLSARPPRPVGPVAGAGTPWSSPQQAWEH